MRRLLQRIEPAVEIARRRARNTEDLHTQAVRLHAQRFVTQLRARSRFLRQLDGDGKFSLLPAVYEMDTGDIRWLKDDPEVTAALDTPAAPTIATIPSAQLMPVIQALPAAPTGATSPTAPAAIPTVPTAPGNLTVPPIAVIPGVAPGAPMPAFDVRIEPPAPIPLVPVKTPEHPAPAPIDPDLERRNRALLLTIMAAAMVAVAGLLLVLLWQRRNMTYLAAHDQANDYDDYQGHEER
jgi:hypothetical protein